MRFLSLTLMMGLLAACGGEHLPGMAQSLEAGVRPEKFPARIWAACDFERLRNDVVWGGRLDTANLPDYPGNRIAAAARDITTDIHGISVYFNRYPRADSGSKVYFRYYMQRYDQIDLRLYNLDRQAWHRVTVTGLERGRWAEATVDFSAVDADSGGGPLRSGERVSEAALMVYGSGELLIDDLICFSGEPKEDEREKFPRRVIALWGFDPLEYYHPWTHTDYRIERGHEQSERDWGAAGALESGGSNFKRIRLIIDPPQQVGEHTRVRYGCYLENIRRVQPMIFDLTDSDNRHVGLENQPQGEWFTQTVDFTARGIKNNGDQTPFEPGSLVDDMFFLAWPSDSSADFSLLVDNVVLYDAR